MHKKLYFLYLILLLSGTLLQRAQAQVYANSQTNGVTGLCLLCGVTNAGNAVNTNLNDYPTYNISVGFRCYRLPNAYFSCFPLFAGNITGYVFYGFPY